MKKLLVLFPLFLLVVSCDFDVFPSQDYPSGPSDLNVNSILGDYTGTTHYYINDSVISNLSYTGHSKINRKSGDILKFSFDTAFVYTIPDIDFELSGYNITLSQGQDYILHSRSYFEMSSGVIYYLNIKSTDPDSIYNLRMYGVKNY